MEAKERKSDCTVVVAGVRCQVSSAMNIRNRNTGEYFVFDTDFVSY